MTDSARHAIFETATGFAAIGWSEKGISSFRLPASTAKEAERTLHKRLPDSMPSMPPPEVAAVIEGARRYFEGGRVDFGDVLVDLGAQDPFFERIYAFVRAMPYGETTTYGAVAKALGAGPEAARIVGEAMARNPVPLIIPCHRVTAAGGKIGGFSAPGGSTSKAYMLTLEGAIAPPRKDPQIGFGF